MPQLTKKIVVGKVGRGGRRAKDRTVYLVRWTQDGKVREKRYDDHDEAERHHAELVLKEGKRKPTARETKALRTTFGDLADLWITSLADAATGVGRRTRDTYESYLNNHVRPTWSARFIDTISESDFVALREHVTTYKRANGSAMSPRAQREVLRLARAVLLEAVDRKLVENAPGERVTIDRTTAERSARRVQHRNAAFTANEVYTLLQSADALAADKNPQRRDAWRSYRGLVYLIVYAGLRLSEARAIRRKDIDLAARVIHIEQRADAHNEIGLPKSEHGVRTVPVNDDACDALRIALGVHKRDLVFSTSEGKPLHERNVRTRVFDVLLDRADVLAAANEAAADAAKDPRIVRVDRRKGRAFHGLRHAFAARLIAAKGSAKELQTQVGHHSAAFTLDRYGHLLDAHQEEVRQRMKV